MYEGRTVFTQLMDHLPRRTFRRLVVRYDGNSRVKTFTCWDQFLCMAFAQLTYRESLRDIEACLGAVPPKLYHLGFRTCTVARSTLADANERTVYALDATTIDLCLSLFPWAPFRTTKAGIKLHTLLDVRGAIPVFIWITDAKRGDVEVLDVLIPEPGSIYLMDRAHVDFERLHRLNKARATFVTRARRTSGGDAATPIPCRPSRSPISTGSAGKSSCSSSGSSSTCASKRSSGRRSMPSRRRSGSRSRRASSWRSPGSVSESSGTSTQLYRS